MTSTWRGIAVALLLLAAWGCGQDATTTTPAAPAPPPPLSPDSGSVAAWLDANVDGFDGPHLSLPHSDLDFLPSLVGDARIVALGEATHGTRDFFEMKARILRFLVEEMGFDTFAIEATWPEARRLDAYVRTGAGDAARLLSGLYFWTWNTESVLEMIEWMREHNEAGGDVGFHGVDMQFPGMALHEVREYIREWDPEQSELMTEKLECLTRFANGPNGRFPSRLYSDETDAYRSECGADLQEARALLVGKQQEYEALSGEEAFAVALQSHRVAFQFHMQAVGAQSRDESMAENTVWLSERTGPEGRMVLWAHNYHVSTQIGAQGYYLRQTLGDDMIVLGFSHERGRFTAVEMRGARFVGRGQFDLDELLAGSFESYFAAAAAPRFVLDLRPPPTAPGSRWLAGSRPLRDIGCCYDPARPKNYWRDTPLSEWYDGIIHFETTRPTTVLPHRPPTSF